MPPLVLDSWALIAFFEDEAAAAAVEAILFQAIQTQRPLLLSVINWAEVYYTTLREVSIDAAESRVREIETLGIELVEIGGDLKLARQAARLKARGGISLADAFAAALTQQRQAELLTGDPEFKVLQKDIKIHWLTRGR